jgi:hypothetical protein
MLLETVVGCLEVVEPSMVAQLGVDLSSLKVLRVVPGLEAAERLE